METIQTILTDIRKKVQNHPTGSLPLSDRIKLYELIDNPTLINKIFLECAKKVFFLWESSYPSPTPISDILVKAEDFLYRNKGNKEDFSLLADTNRNYADDDETEAGTAGLSVISMAYSINNDAAICKMEDYKGEDDDSFDPDSWLPDYTASLAFAGGELLNESGKSKREEYWLWFLDTAGKLIEDSSIPILPLTIVKDISKNNSVEFQRTQQWNIQNIRDILDDIMERMAETFDEDGYEDRWSRCSLHARNCQMGITYTVELETEDKFQPYNGYDMNIPDLFQEIKDIMYKQVPVEGGWCFCDLIFTPYSEDPIEIDFFYDSKELFEKAGITPDFIKAEFKAYPRAKEFTPEWMQKVIGKKAPYKK